MGRYEEDEEDALDALGDQMSQNIRDMKANFTSRLIGLRSSVFGPNLDSDGLLQHYIPMLGGANYNLLALTVLNPRLVRNLNASIGIGRDLTTGYMASAVTGFGLYLGLGDAASEEGVPEE